MLTYFDGHCDTIGRCIQTGEHLSQNGGDIDLVRVADLGGYAQIFALFYDSANAPDEPLFPIARRQYARYLREIEQSGGALRRCRTAQEVRAAFAAGKSAALLGIEGSELLDCDPSRVETAAGWGAKYVTLTWNHANALSGTNAEQTDAGLTDTGRAFVRELARCRVLPDVSHLSDRGFWDVVELGLGPVIASHSNSRAICAHPRNLTDDMFRAIIQSGGIAGLNFYQDFVGGTEYNFGALLRHADHFLELGGENALCFGGDLDGCEQLCAGMQGLQSIHTLYAAFSAHGYDDALLRKLFFENWLRLLECVE